MVGDRPNRRNITAEMQNAAETMQELSHKLPVPASGQDPKEMPYRKYLAFTRALCDANSWWFGSNSGFYLEVLPLDQDEIIKKLEFAIRAIRHTK